MKLSLSLFLAYLSLCSHPLSASSLPSAHSGDPSTPCEYFVATDGNDDNSGESRDVPLKSPNLALEKAMNCSVSSSSPSFSPAIVSLVPGVFYLSSSLTILGSDTRFQTFFSQTSQTPKVIIRTALSATPPQTRGDSNAQRRSVAQSQAVLSGALHVPASSFSSHARSLENGGTTTVYTAKLQPNLNVSQLYGPDGSLRQRARLPNISPQSAVYQRGLDDNSTLHWDVPLAPCSGSTCPDVNKLGFVYEAGAPLRADFTNMKDIDVLVFQAWGAMWHPLGAILPSNRTLLFGPAETNSVAIGQFASLSGHRYLLENVYEGLDAPGEWYYNRLTGELSVVPLPGDPPAAAFAVDLPVLDTLISVSDGASGVTLSNLGLRHTHPGPRGRFTAFSQIAAVQFGPNVTDIAVQRCHVEGTGAQGIALEAPLRGALVEDTVIENTGGEGLAMVRATTPGLVLADVLVQYTRVNNSGIVFLQQPAGMRIRSGVGGNVTVQFCEVGYVPYGGILIGWQPGGATPPGVAGPPADQVNITVRYNHVHDFGLGLLSDFGAIYISSDNNACFDVSDCNLPTLIENNIVSHGRHYDYGSQGFYTDEQVSGQRLQSNLFYDIGDGGIFFHCGTGHTSTNNVVAYAGQQPKGSYLRSCNAGGNPTWPNLPHGFVMDHTIFYVADRTGHEQLTVDSDYRLTEFDFNLYYSANSSLQLNFPNHTTWAQWRASGQDAHGRMADPMFADAANANFTLLPSSPAFSLGIQQIDLSFGVGPRSEDTGMAQPVRLLPVGHAG